MGIFSTMKLLFLAPIQNDHIKGCDVGVPIQDADAGYRSCRKCEMFRCTAPGDNVRSASGSGV